MINGPVGKYKQSSVKNTSLKLQVTLHYVFYTRTLPPPKKNNGSSYYRPKVIVLSKGRKLGDVGNSAQGRVMWRPTLTTNCTKIESEKFVWMLTLLFQQFHENIDKDGLAF